MPLGVLVRTLAQVGADEQSRTEYEQNLLPLVYGSFKPHFDEAFASFEKVARTFLSAANQAAPCVVAEPSAALARPHPDE